MSTSPSATTTCPRWMRCPATGFARSRPDRCGRGIGGYALVVTSPGFPPTAPVLAAAAAAEVPIWGDVELAWRLDATGRYGPPRKWLVVTGTNGKTTTTSMLHAMLVADGRRAVLCGNIGEPVLDVLSQPADLLAVELSSFQLHWAPRCGPRPARCSTSPKTTWTGTAASRPTPPPRPRALGGRVAVAGVDDAPAAALLAAAPAGVKAGFRLGEPSPGSWGCATGGWWTGRSPTTWTCVRRRRSRWQARSGCSTRWAPPPWPGGGRSGRRDRVRARRLPVGRHRAEPVGVVAGVRYVDDSKATNPHAAQASVLAYPRVVWVAGGLLKGRRWTTWSPRWPIGWSARC